MLDLALPTEYSPLTPPRTVRGADWFIGGRRYHETGRTPTERGERITLTLQERS